MGLPEKDLQAVETASVLHDVGKIGVPNEIRLKPGRLSDDEYGLVKKQLSPEGGRQFDPEVLHHFLDLAAQHVDDIAQIREPAT